MPYYLLALLITFTISAQAQSTQQSVIYEGKGIDSLKLGDLSAARVKQILGPDFQATNHGNYSIELFYQQLGIAFYRKYGPDTGKIFCIAVRPAYQGRTAMGFKISTMTVQDMLRIYGKADWTYLERDTLVYASYEDYGIYFAIKPHGVPPARFKTDHPDKSQEKARNDYFMNLYYNDKLLEMTIGIPGTDF